MTDGVAGSWARLRLVQGDSSTQERELGGAREQTTLSVGSGPSSSWVVRADAVRPLHFSLHWDGETLRIADTYGAGDVRADGTAVTAQWRSLSGRIRIDFGKAAMVVETSTSISKDATRSDEPAAAPADGGSRPPGADANSVQRLQKATLIGVSPLANGVVMGGAAATPASEPSSDSTPPSESGSFRPARPESERTRKPTLLGMAVTVPPAAAVPAEAAPAAAPRVPATGIPTGTLIGVMGPTEVRVQRLANVSDGAPGQVVLQDLRVGGARPELAAGAVTQAEVRTVTTPPVHNDRTERIGSTWQETSDAPVPAAVMVGRELPHAGANEPQQPQQNAGFDGYEYGDMPTQMREAAGLESRRPPASFPWRYVGIAVLTAAAYFAWLYLLDHL